MDVYDWTLCYNQNILYKGYQSRRYFSKNHDGILFDTLMCFKGGYQVHSKFIIIRTRASRIRICYEFDFDDPINYSNFIDNFQIAEFDRVLFWTAMLEKREKQKMLSSGV